VKNNVIKVAGLILMVVLLVGLYYAVELIQSPKEIEEKKAAEEYTLPIKPQTIYVSSELDTTTWKRSNLIDGDLTTNWSTKQSIDGDLTTNWSTKQSTTGADINEWVLFDFGSVKKIATIVVTARVLNNRVESFPLNFHITVGEGENTKILPGREFINYKAPLPAERKIAFTIDVNDRYVGLGFTKTVPNAYDAYHVQLAEVEFYQSECTSDLQCGEGGTCNNGVCGVNTKSYWSLQPGNYWIFQGVDAYGGEKYNFRSRFDSEQTVEMCVQYKIIPWRFTRNNDCPDPHQCWWGNMRFGMADPSLDDQPYFWSLFDKRYYRIADNPYGDIGSLYERSRYQVVQEANHYTLPSYLYTPKFLTDFEDKIEYRYQHYVCTNEDDGSLIGDWNVCKQACTFKAYPNLIMRYKKVDIDTPAYSGPALLLSQGEESHWENVKGWCTREDWYLAPGVGIVRVDQWSCNNNNYCYDAYGNKSDDCQCNGWYDDPENHPNCYQNIAIDNAPEILSGSETGG